jgi:hypothetical protein
MSRTKFFNRSITALAFLASVLGACSKPAPQSESTSGASTNANPQSNPSSTPTPAPTSDATSEAPRAAAETNADRSWILDQAMSVASAIPTTIHDRERAQCQEWVALAHLDAGDPIAAARCAETIEGWRRGECEGLIGVHYALKGDRELALKYARLAMDRATGEQDWRRERIHIEAAKIHAILGNASTARDLSADASQAEVGKVDGALVAVLTPEQFEAQAKVLDEVIKGGTFDGMRNALDAYLPLLRRMTANRTQALAAAATIDAALPAMPMDLQIIYGTRLASALHALGETGRAKERLDLAAKQVAETVFLPEDLTPMQVEVAKARAGLGDVAGARAALDAALTSYESRKKEIVDVFRARSPRALAEGFQAIGDQAKAESCWLEALAAGTINPNSRPRAEDLSATLVAMARSGAAVAPALRERIAICRKSLGEPW